jgi:hypothetical protein
MRVFVANAFSLQMVNLPANFSAREITLDEVRDLLSKVPFESGIGHQSTAMVASKLTGVPIHYNRTQLKLEHGDQLIVLQLMVRLEEGRTLTEEEILSLPHKWVLVQVC